MYRKFFAFILLTTFSAAVSIAQDAPAPQKDDKARAESLYRIAFGSGGYLGIELKEVSSENYQDLGLSEVRGVAVQRVLKDSAAEKAGLTTGDVIIAFNGEKITSTRKFTRLVREVAPDHKVDLTVIRGGSEIQIPVTMGKRKGLAFVTSEDFEFPAPQIAPDFEFPKVPVEPLPPIAPNIQVLPDGMKIDGVRAFSFFSGRVIGIGVVPLTKQLGDYFGVEGGKGLLINDVSNDSPAEKAGLRAGDVIVEIDGKAVNNLSDLFRGMGREKEGAVILTIVRDRTRQTISVTPEKRKNGNLRFDGYDLKTKDESN